jgi:hypothetical protein
MVAISPQLTDQSVDSTMIFGRGYSASISSDCTCLHSVTLEELVHAEMTLGDAQKAIEIYNSWDRGSGIVNEVSQSNNSVRIRSILMGTNVCGGYNNTHPPAPFCTTYIDDFSNALVSVSFMKNTIAPATSFAKIVQVREKSGLANIDWLYNGLVLLNEGTLNGFRLATGYPNSINPLLKWTTTSKQNVNAAKVEEGLEALFAAMSRAAVQRSFLTKGSSCSTTVVDQDRLVLRIGYIGLAFGVIYIVVELLYLSVVAYVFAQWFLSEYPVLPAIRFVHEKQYFTVMLSQLMQLPFISEINATLEQVHYWPKLDIFMRIGESINTVDDHDFGVISIDKPKKITHLSWTKEYQ